MSDGELARSLFGTRRRESATAAKLQESYGTARTDSSDGTVTVDIGGNVVDLPTRVAVKAGDVVAISVTGASAVVTGATGNGDAAAAEIKKANEQIAKANSTAEQARETADAANAEIAKISCNIVSSSPAIEMHLSDWVPESVTFTAMKGSESVNASITVSASTGDSAWTDVASGQSPLTVKVSDMSTALAGFKQVCATMRLMGDRDYASWESIGYTEWESETYLGIVSESVASSLIIPVITEANTVAMATKQHFFYDSKGAHVTENDNDADTGANTLITSAGFAVRDGTEELTSITKTRIELGKNSTTSSISMCGGKFAIEYTGSEGITGLGALLHPTEQTSVSIIVPDTDGSLDNCKSVVQVSKSFVNISSRSTSEETKAGVNLAPETGIVTIGGTTTASGISPGAKVNGTLSVSKPLGRVPDSVVGSGLAFVSGLGTINDLTWSSIYGVLPPGSYLVDSAATGSPHNGSYGNMMLSYAADNRLWAVIAFDDGQIWQIYGSDSAKWGRIDDKWTLLGTRTGAVTITLPTSWNELLVIAGYNWRYQYIVPYGYTGNLYQGMDPGGTTYCRIDMLNNTVQLSDCYENGTSVLSSAMMYVYTR